MSTAKRGAGSAVKSSNKRRKGAAGGDPGEELVEELGLPAFCRVECDGADGTVCLHDEAGELSLSADTSSVGAVFWVEVQAEEEEQGSTIPMITLKSAKSGSYVGCKDEKITASYHELFASNGFEGLQFALSPVGDSPLPVHVTSASGKHITCGDGVVALSSKAPASKRTKFVLVPTDYEEEEGARKEDGGAANEKAEAEEEEEVEVDPNARGGCQVM